MTHGYNDAMRMARPLRNLLVVFLATVLTTTMAGVAAAQEPTPDEVLTMLDRVQAQLQQMSSDLDSGASQQKLVQDASGALALLLSVEESLKPLYQDWPTLRGHAESLYQQAAQAPPDTLRPIIASIQEGIVQAREAAQRWKAGGTSLTLEDVGAYPGEETWVSLSLARVPAAGVASYDATISFNADVLRVTNVTFTKGRGNWKTESGAGAITLHGDGLKLGATQQPQELARVDVLVLGQEKEMSVLSLRGLAVYDGAGGRVPVTATDGSVRVLAGQAPPDQRATPTPTPTPEPTSSRVLGLSPVYLAVIVAALAVILVGVGARFLLSRR
ncbi:MAG: cohesin domain-containing protein [Chloroflexota bacterium]|nr:cohesin domain-containing protein [Chloroflexota bacterium]